MTYERKRNTETEFPPLSSSAAEDLIGRQFDHLAKLETRYGAFAAGISGWSVGGHAMHLALSGSSMAISLLSGRHWEGVPSAPEFKEQILQSGTIPSGCAAAPESVRPGTDRSSDDILSALAKCRARVARISWASGDTHIVHPYLGRLTRDELVRFIAIHNRHHIDIIDRILAAV